MWFININFPHWRHLFTDWKSSAEDERPLATSLPQVNGRGETQAKWCSLIVSWYCCFWAGVKWQKLFSRIWSSQKSRSCNMLWSLWTRRNTSPMMSSEIKFHEWLWSDIAIFELEQSDEKSLWQLFIEKYLLLVLWIQLVSKTLCDHWKIWSSQKCRICSGLTKP